MSPQPFNSKTLSGADIKNVTKLCKRIHYTNSNESFTNHVYLVMKQAFSCNHFTTEHVMRNPMVLRESIHDTVPANISAIFKKFMHQHPALVQTSNTRHSNVGNIKTGMNNDQFYNSELYNEVFVSLGIKDQMWVGVGDENEWTGATYARDSVFSEKELFMLTWINPHLQIAWQNWKRSRDLEQRLLLLEEKNIMSEETTKQARKTKQLMDRLSPRQRDIAELIAQGLENREIARALHIAPKTVNKHLENIFQTLDIHHRAALAAQWRQQQAR